ncbi:probable UDP-3-O-acylglucosamine N-acyltransferase 2, mitochondrial isoform X2 [Amborella trichopoda]|uniref:probable UDP-3-O-acylglucosamine N-acyltransferase 2, mitochondrial isoform X2 n=1 Tax=Amborella trichopoda TaxID=13333 RepID=UPI0009BF86AD|nr:probable UDP-3-O-acylglucosamine N-acyltransferase 2, mitochondrial isoform X2 [Amborella trichopoda]|eukprot:XP_020525251.1 probable UDP-3-O-acylglucosamine N-acyltransferase 2, mitochondrial isoform X2 [Amborella trichopoda]
MRRGFSWGCGPIKPVSCIFSSSLSQKSEKKKKKLPRVPPPQPISQCPPITYTPGRSLCIPRMPLRPSLSLSMSPGWAAISTFRSGVFPSHFRALIAHKCYSSSNSGDDDASLSEVMGQSMFEKWHNGGGLFHKSSCIDPTAVIEAGSIVHPKAVLGANVHLGSGAVVGPSVKIGHSAKIGYNAVVCNCSIGESCIIHSGVCIGQDGFGFLVDAHGNLVKKPQLLYARIGNHVEIGANSCIDRGSWRDTVIGDHTKIDNLVQIAHNVVIGKCCIICGQVGVAGSVMIGDNVTLGGKVAIRDHVKISSKVRFAANSCVTKDITEPGDYGGFPAVPIHEWRRQVASINRVGRRSRPGNT